MIVDLVPPRPAATAPHEAEREWRTRMGPSAQRFGREVGKADLGGVGGGGAAVQGEAKAEAASGG